MNLKSNVRNIKLEKIKKDVFVSNLTMRNPELYVKNMGKIFNYENLKINTTKSTSNLELNTEKTKK